MHIDNVTCLSNLRTICVSDSMFVSDNNNNDNNNNNNNNNDNDNDNTTTGF